MITNPSPAARSPSWAERFATDDLDELHAFVARSVGDHSRVAVGPGSLGFEQHWVGAGAATVGWIRTGLRSVVRGAVPDPVIHLSLPPGASYRFGRRSHSVDTRSATFIAPAWDYTLDNPGGWGLGLRVAGRRLLTEMRARDPGARDGVAFVSRNLRLDAQERSTLLGAVADFVRTTEPAKSPRQAAFAEARLLATVADVLQEGCAIERAQVISASRVADVEAWIDAHLEEPITIGRLCEVAGSGERWLQKIFQSRRGMSPMRFVTERRLAAARRRLAAAGGAGEVTTVALSLGFSHVGRFATLYRQAYGESPSQTVRRAGR